MADDKNTSDDWGSPDIKQAYDDMMRKRDIERTQRAWEKGERAPGTLDLDPVVPKTLDVRAPEAPAPIKKPGVFSNLDAFIKQGRPTLTKPAKPEKDNRVVKTGYGGEVSTGSGGKLRTRSSDEFSSDPQSYYKRMMSPANEDAEMSELLRLSGQLNEKAVSKQQQKFMGMVHAMQKGEKIKGASPELKKVSKTMSKKDAKDFASTKHKGLPKKVTEDVMLDEGGTALKHITNRFKHEVKNFMNSGFMDEDLYDALYDYYTDTGEMPYAVAKARTGDPHQWVEERFYQDMGSGMSESADMSLNELARLAGLKEVATTYPVPEPEITSAETYPVPSPDAQVGKPFKGSVTVSIPGGPSATVGDDDLDEDLSGSIQVHNFDGMSGRDIYDETQTNDNIKDGDVLVTDTGVGIMVSAWPVVVVGDIDGFHKIRAGVSWEEFEGGQYLNSAQKAMEVAGKLEEEFANAPDEEYQTIASITRQGNDLNREKKQFANKPKLGDNPMATDVNLDEELSSLLDSVLIRRDEMDEGAFDDAMSAAGRAATRVGQAVGDIVGTEASALRQSQQLRDLDKYRQQYKGTPAGQDYEKRYQQQLVRTQSGQGEVMDYDPKTGKQTPRVVTPPPAAPAPVQTAPAKPYYRDPLEAEKGGIKGATMPPPDSKYPPGDPRNMKR